MSLATDECLEVALNILKVLITFGKRAATSTFEGMGLLFISTIVHAIAQIGVEYHI